MKITSFLFLLLALARPGLQAQQPSKLFVLSDVEGDYGAFHRLLQAGGVIDKKKAWTFGDGHLVLIGDMLDRGDSVLQTMALIRQLESKAGKKGGAVHYVLGNHEVMNLSGDLRYVHPSYWLDSVNLRPDYQHFLSPRSATGRWLRHKNIIEKVGNFLFVHGGIAPALNALPLTIDELNARAKPLYDSALYDQRFTDPVARLLFDAETTSPFWYRGYYARYAEAYGGPVAEKTLDSTLAKFGVQHIVTGHSVVADTASMHFGGKLFNTDTQHAAGKSEALLVENGEIYRINLQGDRRLLYKTEQ